MRGVIKKQFILPLIILLLGLFFTNKANAASLANISDTITTSRPSASAPLASNQAASAGQVTINDNGSIFLASDSAILWPDTGETLNTVNVASMSAANTPSANQRIVYFTNTAANTHHAGDPITTAISAMHKIRFTTIAAIPASGKVVITFPGSGVNTASPSATTFAFNGLNATGGLPSTIVTNNITCNTNSSVSAPNITCETTGSVAANTTITFLIGCTVQSGGECTTASPRMINPTKTAAAGTADTWKISVKTQDASATPIDLDTGSAKIGTVEAVQVQGTVEPTLTFTIAGLANSTNYNSSASQCGSETSNSGVDSTATFVNLGVLSNGYISKAGQTLTVSTNGSAGYAITATSSGRFINPASGFWIPGANSDTALTANDTPVPTSIVAGTPEFGISPCGIRVPTASPNWGGTGQTVASGALFSNPWNTGTNSYYATIASYTGGAVTSEVTVIRYASTVSGTTPAGIYSNYFTYVATATF